MERWNGLASSITGAQYIRGWWRRRRQINLPAGLEVRWWRQGVQAGMLGTANTGGGGGGGKRTVD